VGATSWCHYTPWLPDPNQALQALRADVFARRDYVSPDQIFDKSHLQRLEEAIRTLPRRCLSEARRDDAVLLERALETGDLSGLSRELRSAARNLQFQIRVIQSLRKQKLPRLRKPRSIDDLITLACENGTHSILDIQGVAARPGFAVASPMSATVIRRVFGTVTPTHAVVERRWGTFGETLRRWQCRYLTIYVNGKPHEYAFIGCSGD
jgi:hypothetical protein